MQRRWHREQAGLSLDPAIGKSTRQCRSRDADRSADDVANFRDFDAS
jgi:hypothetical protein